MNTTEVKSLLQSHLQKYPAMTWQDMVKLLYQNEFGGGHLITDEAQNLYGLQKEYAALPSVPAHAAFIPAHSPSAPLWELPWEDIGNGFCRCHLKDLPPEALYGFHTLFRAASHLVHGSRSRSSGEKASCGHNVLEGFIQKLAILASFAAEHFSEEQSRDCLRYLDSYKQNGCPQPRHSAAYREAYSPAYRVLPKDLAALVPVLTRIDTLLNEHFPVVLAIDGRCGSGKTALSAFLSKLYDTYVIHMDDFFLPAALRTQERLSQPGGNIHYERFQKEVLKPLSEGAPTITYRRFSCRTMDYDGSFSFAPSSCRLLVVEGSYSLRPEFVPAYDITLFTDVEETLQLERIRQRSGETMLPAFQNKWIPMENRYFSYYRTADSVSCALAPFSLEGSA